MQANSKIINLVTRDVSKTFDQVWHEGLRYKLYSIDYDKSPLNNCLFLEQKKTMIKVND